jgi:hypothetical protein
MDIVAAIGEQARALGAPRSASSWPPLIVLGVGLLALVSACVGRRWTRGVIWLLQSAALLGLIWLQFRTTRHMAAPSPESHAKLLNAGTLLLVGWLVVTGPAASRRAGQPPPGWSLAHLGLCGVALAVLLSLSGSLSLALESLVIPATACGLALGSLGLMVGLMGTQPSVADGQRPMVPHAIWCAVSLSYVLLGNLLATVTLRSAWLWVLAACAVSLGSVGLGSAKAWWLRIAFVLATICLLLGAVIPAYIQFARDTAF